MGLVKQDYKGRVVIVRWLKRWFKLITLHYITDYRTWFLIFKAKYGLGLGTHCYYWLNQNYKAIMCSLILGCNESELKAMKKYGTTLNQNNELIFTRVLR